MSPRPFLRSASRLATAAAAIPAAAYLTYVSNAWRRYGRPAAPKPDEEDDFLDQFMPFYDVVERHGIAVAAPPEVVLAAAMEQDLMSLPVVQAIFKARELVMGASPNQPVQSRGLVSACTALGWGVLAERPGREIVVGEVTRPWEANVTFRTIPVDRFAGYNEPGDVKIIWTLRADPAGEHESIFRTETRAVATDAGARARFRKYWALASPGISAIRWLTLRPLKQEAERRARNTTTLRGLRGSDHRVLCAHSSCAGAASVPATE